MSFGREIFGDLTFVHFFKEKIRLILNENLLLSTNTNMFCEEGGCNKICPKLSKSSSWIPASQTSKNLHKPSSC